MYVVIVVCILTRFMCFIKVVCCFTEYPMNTSERCYAVRCKLYPRETVHAIRVTFLTTSCTRNCTRTRK